MPMKIYELAKEVEVESALALVEELKNRGFTSVKNHMSSLTDEEVAKFLEMRRAEQKSSTASDSSAKKRPATTKKTVKAAAQTVKKKISTVNDSADSAVVATAQETKKVDDEASKQEKAAPLKKTVIRRKKSDEDIVDEVDLRDDSFVESDEDGCDEAKECADECSVDEDTQQEELFDPNEKKSEDSSSTSGLRVVAMPEKREKTPVVQTSTPAQNEQVVVGVKPKFVEKKRHTFTPVYIPPAQPVETKAPVVEKSLKPVASVNDVGFDDSLFEKDEKRKIGGLAALVSGKKGPTSNKHNRLVAEQKSVEELKNYAALNTFGKPIYKQIGRKRAYLGGAKTSITEVKDSKRVLSIHQAVKVLDLADKLSVKVEDFIDKAIDLNLLLNEGDYLGLDLAKKLAALYSYRVEDKAFNEDVFIGKQVVDKKEEKVNHPSRGPIITIMGHVDHGKTTLLDYIRKTKVAAGEAGGITQHIGAYLVSVKDKTLTFLDTPGHAAFASMRQRGANVTDVVILVVAADDGVMPQTKESIRFCKEAKVPIIVAVNKMDKEGANPDRVKQGLVEFGLTPELWGGDTLFAEVSAISGSGIDDLLEKVALLAEMMELAADPKAPVEAVVIESKVEQGRGPIATILVQSGTLEKGDYVVVGEVYGRARTLYDTTGKEVKFAGPSTPVQILGLIEPAIPGDILNVVKSEREAKKIVSNRIDIRRELASAPEAKVASLEDFFAGNAVVAGEKKVLKLVIRSDVNGSYEAIKQAVETLGNDEVSVNVIGGGVGAITDNDVNLASSSNGYIFGFNMRPVTSARRLAEQKGVEIRNYSIIYELIDDVKLALEGLLEPEFIEKYIGRAEVKDTFVIPKIGTIAGSAVIDGKIIKGCKIRLLRDGKIVFDGKMSSLKRFKDDVKEVNNGYECGIGLEDYNDIKSNDVFEAYMIEEKRRKLENMTDL